jgi:hypothetical protein
MTPLSPNVSQPKTLRQAWEKYISCLPEIMGQPYEYFGSFTYRDAEEIPSRHAEDIVRKRFSWFLVNVNEAIYGRRWKRQSKGVWGVMATEKHLSGYPHHHAIVGGENLRAQMKYVEMEDIWRNLYGIAKVRNYRGKSADKYMCKYVSKGGIVEPFHTAMGRANLKP